jgi:hypothetical protein
MYLLRDIITQLQLLKKVCERKYNEKEKHTRQENIKIKHRGPKYGLYRHLRLFSCFLGAVTIWDSSVLVLVCNVGVGGHPNLSSL